jgi:tRNA A-37 threonylcarbamoyl transferase component Bud32
VKKRGWFGRALAWARGERDLPAPIEDDGVDEPVRRRSEDELWLEQLSAAVGENRRGEEVAGAEFGEHIHGLWERGHERLAVEWLSKFIAAPATPADKLVALRLRIVDLLERRNELGEAVVHLEALAEVDDHATRANYLLAEHYRRRGEEVLALRHYEAVLARDVDYPNVRIRVDRLRAARGQLSGAAVGETIAGAGLMGVAEGAHYHLVRELGRGATAVVYMARDSELERDVAVKLLHPHLAAAQRAGACGRFFAEARIAASLRHPNILAILDIDEKARRIVMELAAGGTLRSVLSERGPRSMRRALERHAQILSALAAAHRRGIVHRDLKPGNLMFRRDADAPGVEIVLGDFGVAHLPDVEGATGAAAAEVKKHADAVGTLAYMSPEQRRGVDADPRVDLYAAAVVLFEMLTGRHPWSAEVLLAGTRTKTDFRLPEAVTRGHSPELVAMLSDHLDMIGDPEVANRPTTAAAVAQARTLRDHVVVSETTR